MRASRWTTPPREAERKTRPDWLAGLGAGGIWAMDHIGDAWASLLGSVSWDHFCTLTYRAPVRAAEKVERDVRAFVFGWCLEEAVRRGQATVEADGRPGKRGRIKGAFWRDWRAGRNHPQWVVGIEHHRDGPLHAHLLVRWSRRSRCRSFAAAAKVWHHDMKAGFVQVERCRSDLKASGYVAKYAAKGGDVALSPNFTTPTLFANHTH